MPQIRCGITHHTGCDCHEARRNNREAYLRGVIIGLQMQISSWANIYDIPKELRKQMLKISKEKFDDPGDREEV